MWLTASLRWNAETGKLAPLANPEIERTACR